MNIHCVNQKFYSLLKKSTPDNTFSTLILYDFINNAWFYIGFSLQNWLSTKGEREVSGLLPEYVQYMLLEDRGISNMMKDVPCSKTLVPWDNSTNIGIGWTTSKIMYTETLSVNDKQFWFFLHNLCKCNFSYPICQINMFRLCRMKIILLKAWIYYFAVTILYCYI